MASESSISLPVLRQLEQLVLRTYFRDRPAGFLETDDGRFLFKQHVWERYEQSLNHLAPWVERTAGIRGLRLVEIGSGTGSIAAGFAAMTKSFDGYEIEQGSVDVANQRLAILGVKGAHIHQVAGEQILATVADRHRGRVDAFLLYAVLEHMTLDERLATLRMTAELLPPGGLLIVIETPNRLCYTDLHTSQLPFFHMLPLALAARYYEHSPRPEFVRTVEISSDRLMEITRWGTAVSYHEFDLTLGADLDEHLVADGFEPEVTSLYPMRLEDELLQQFFREAKVNRHRAFTRNHLNFIWRKPSGWQAPRDRSTT
jgi:S-adenosylmethionine-dependent methyltransferase